MSPRIARLTVAVMASALMLVAMTGCFFQGEEEPEPTETPDLAATIAAAVSAAVPSPTPPPTNTPTPEPDLAATLQAMMAAAQAAAAPTPAAVAPTNTPAPPPTAVPVPTDTPAPLPTDTPTPVQAPNRTEFEIPCIVAGKVTIGGSTPPAGTPVFAVSQAADATVVAESKTDTAGSYQLAIKFSGEPFDIFVRAADSGVDTPACITSGHRQRIDLNVQ